MTHEGENVLDVAATWLAEGRKVAAATVVSTWRSSPCPVGSQMVVDDRGRFAGSVSGGCVETSVIEESRGYLKDSTPRSLRFGVTNERAWEVGLPCGGKIEIFLGPADPDVIGRLREARAGRRTLGLVTEQSTGEQRLFDADDPPDDLDPAVAALLVGARGRELGKIVDGASGLFFVQVVGPPLRLVIVGAVHLAQLLARMARLAEYPVTVVDPRTAFANEERFPDAELVFDWPGSALRSLGLDRRTAVVTLSHDAKIDEPALGAALESDCFYVGALGGRKTQEARRRRLREAGFSDEQLSRIHGPVGLDIGASTAPEIAVSILAQVVEHWRRGIR